MGASTESGMCTHLAVWRRSPGVNRLENKLYTRLTDSLVLSMSIASLHRVCIVSNACLNSKLGTLAGNLHGMQFCGIAHTFSSYPSGPPACSTVHLPENMFPKIKIQGSVSLKRFCYHSSSWDLADRILRRRENPRGNGIFKRNVTEDIFCFLSRGISGGTWTTGMGLPMAA